MSVIAFNILWVLCVLLLLLALFLAIRRRRLAARQAAQANQAYQYRQQTQSGPGVRIYMPSYYEFQAAQAQYGQHGAGSSSSNDPESGIHPPPPTYKPDEVELPPPSYQDYRKDPRIQAISMTSPSGIPTSTIATPPAPPPSTTPPPEQEGSPSSEYRRSQPHQQQPSTTNNTS
ncbi:hypothetical protein BDA99DRAFT_559834 [Phascolomyces articulosus]|uniref:Uncharacterized protein n=1 Tax=Phascolomyces articulosus TaxID=60185 RepID=A0AAD5KDM8_9FUNG|nr:hypothetical protein BDA99DRAFT_559834 [Phascolomyces articulosus]